MEVNTHINKVKMQYIWGNVKIARPIAEFEADNFEENGKKIIRIKISTGTNKEEPNFGKTIKYVLRYW